MDQLQAAQFLKTNDDYFFPNKKMTEAEVGRAMTDAPQLLESYLSTMSFKKPTTTQIIAVFLGSIGVDRLYLGDVVRGIIKYFTLGGLGIWWIADIITAKKRCRTANCDKLMKFIEQLPADSTDVKIPAKAEANVQINKEQAIAVGKAAIAMGKVLKQGFDAIQNSMEVK